MTEQMVIESKGIKTDKYFIPPFVLRTGEIVVLFLYNGAHFYDLEMHLVDIFTGKLPHENVKIYKPLTFVPHFKESWIRRLFYPVTVGAYLKKHGGQRYDIAEQIYSNRFITKQTKVNTLDGRKKKLLSIYTTLSNTNIIIFDLVGQDPLGADATYGIVKEHVKNGGAALLLDGFDDMKNDCTRYVALEWL